MLFPANVSAYPQFQLSTGNGRCGACHISPAGGGLLNDWGRDESADTISMGDSDSRFGNPGPLYGAWTPPNWFKFGADFRLATIAKSSDASKTEVLTFPMQADLYTHFKVKGVSANINIGVRGAARDAERPPLVQRLVSREHYLMYQKNDDSPYVRLGRFHVPYGLRLQDHTSYLRRRLGFHFLEEPYTLSAGKTNEAFDLHVSLFMPSPVFQSGRRAKGAALYYEERLGAGNSALGIQAKTSTSELDLQQLFGAVYKHFWEDKKLLLLSELNLGFQDVHADKGEILYQTTGHVSLNYFPKPYLLLGTTLEYHDSDILLKNTNRSSLSLSAQFFPRSHVELMWMSRVELQDLSYGNQIHLLMLHYYL